VAGYRRIDKKRDADIRQYSRNIQPMRENKAMPT
jgi:hypothetical protein